jgi:hypothetical protein
MLMTNLISQYPHHHVSAACWWEYREMKYIIKTVKCILAGYLYITDLINAGKMERIEINVNEFHLKFSFYLHKAHDRHIGLAFQMKMCYQHHALLLMIYTRDSVLMCMTIYTDRTG